MGRLSGFRYRDVAKRLRKLGFIFDRQAAGSHEIWHSLNLPTQADIDHLWAEEAERRITEIDRGDIKLIPGEQVFDTIRRKYGQ